MQVEKGKYVSFTYKFMDENGAIIFDADEQEKTWYIHGHNLILPILEKHLEGLEKGQEFSFEFGPDDAFGHRREELAAEFPKTNLPPDFDPQVGQVIQATNQQGESIPAQIREVKDDTIVIDANHPLAGLNLKCEGKVKEVREATAGETAEVNNYLASMNGEGSGGCSTCGSGGCSPTGGGTGSAGEGGCCGC